MADDAGNEFNDEEKAIHRAVSKVLFQIDKKINEETGEPELSWTDTKGDYLKRGSRIMRTFKRQGLEIVATRSLES